MICDDCKNCNNFFVSEVGCYGSDKPCEYFSSDYKLPLSEDGKIIDEEWDIAERTGTKQTWWVYPDYQREPYKRFVKSYTPALAELIRKRNQALLHPGYRIEPFLH